VLHHEQQRQEKLKTEISQTYLKKEDPADDLCQATAPIEKERKHVTFQIENE
jgi:hypothetical protein